MGEGAGELPGLFGVRNVENPNGANMTGLEPAASAVTAYGSDVTV